MKRFRKIFLRIIITLTVIIISFLLYFHFAVLMKLPLTKSFSKGIYNRLKNDITRVDTNFYKCNDSWLKMNKYGLWEMYIEGNPFQRGVKNGLLTKDLIYIQEKNFVEELHRLVPSNLYLHLLKYFVVWFNRDLDKFVNDEFKKEIYGISLSASDKYLFIGPAYQRMMNYHAAHDIGHALQNMNLAGCTSFSVWGNRSNDSNLIVGRNFDFYAGDEFAQNKIVCFCKPDKGYRFMFITWAGMIGVTSGMNENGLTVTINAAKSEIPHNSGTPISLVAREILQYAKNIKEAYDIAKQYKTNVSESIMIGSKEDNKTAIIEKSINATYLYNSEKDYIICSNHYQGEKFRYDNLNMENILNTASWYRYKRVDELINRNKKLDFKDFAAILRDRRGLNDKDIGMGNEKAINQLIAHHSVIFMPSKLLVWVSTSPWQLGPYVAYDLKKIFKKSTVYSPQSTDNLANIKELNEEELTIPGDSFIISEDYQRFLTYKQMKEGLENYLKSKNSTSFYRIQDSEFVSTNPQFYLVYSLTGDYYKKIKNYNKASYYYKIALTKEIPTNYEKQKIRLKYIRSIN